MSTSVKELTLVPVLLHQYVVVETVHEMFGEHQHTSNSFQ